MQPGAAAQNAYRDVGIGLVNTNGTNSAGPLVVTQDFGTQPSEQAQVVGVAFNDAQGTGSVPARRGGRQRPDHRRQPRQTGQVSSTQTWASGGYELALAPGNISSSPARITR